MTGVTILRGPLLRFRGDPFVVGAAAALDHDGDGAVAFAGGRIVDVGPAEQVLAEHPDADVLRFGPRKLIAPGFVDCHVHYPQTGIIASHGEQLLDWLNRYTFPEEARFADPAHAREVAAAFFTEEFLNGTTTASSFCTIHPASVDAYFEEAARHGARAVGGRTMMDRNAPADLLDTAQSSFEETKSLIERWHGNGRADVAISPRFAPTSTPEQLEAAGALAAAFPDCLIQTHLDETIAEIDWVANLFPAAPDYLGVYERYGLLGAKSLFGHAIHLAPRERDALAASGAAVAHCPLANQFLGSGECDVAGLKRAGVRVGLGTDVGGGTSLSMLAAMKAAYEVAQRRKAVLAPAELWWLATCGSADAIGRGGTVGNLAVGHEADAIVLDLDATSMLARRVDRADSFADVLFALIVLGDDRAVAQTWIDGRRVWDRDADTYAWTAV